MTQILLDITRLITRLYDGLLPTGVDRVGLAYIRRYGPTARAVLSERGFSAIMTERDSQRSFASLLSSSFNKHTIRQMVARTLVNQLRPTRLGRSVLLHTSHNGMEHAHYYQTMTRRGARSVFMVHDLIPITHAEYCRPGVDEAHRRRIHTAIRHADGLIANSQFTCDALAEEAKRIGLSLPPIVVAHLASGIDTLESRGQPPLDAPYFVMLGTIEPRKNHWFILHVWRRITELMGESAPKLVIIGRRGWECENVVDMLERCAPLRGTVIEESNCSDERLSSWLQHARAMLFPSFVEGYGMPLVEALMLRVPVLASNLSVFHEIASDIPDYLDPLDGPAWIAHIQAYAKRDSVERASQAGRIKQFREPTWAEHFEKVDDFIASLD
ncbi:glycosyltransferase family 4 protein [Burkholderia cepacia]|uniref:glycosyltransferase family 4 protein n=1 Tax=Burkholderia cepacia TaxID=292 RepID=UPI000B8A0611|nr:glycosyltransferase family 1 protein [Burkholderia cepacia]MDN7913039.1 glycosyltransferase family 1 protein [Burkholderia cepacia]